MNKSDGIKEIVTVLTVGIIIAAGVRTVAMVKANQQAQHGQQQTLAEKR